VHLLVCLLEVGYTTESKLKHIGTVHLLVVLFKEADDSFPKQIDAQDTRGLLPVCIR